MNQKIRDYAQKQKVKFWQVAERMEMHDSKLSKMLRHELGKEDTDRIMAIISEIAAEKDAADKD